MTFVKEVQIVELLFVQFSADPVVKYLQSVERILTQRG
jgi:hypothetical protein